VLKVIPQIAALKVINDLTKYKTPSKKQKIKIIK